MTFISPKGERLQAAVMAACAQAVLSATPFKLEKAQKSGATIIFVPKANLVYNVVDNDPVSGWVNEMLAALGTVQVLSARKKFVVPPPDAGTSPPALEPNNGIIVAYPAPLTTAPLAA
jgi:hypothetical protein